MSYELCYFRNMEQALKNNALADILDETLKYVDLVLQDNYLRGAFLKEALSDIGWRDSQDMTIIPGRRYRYKGVLNRIAMEASLYSYEGMWCSLFRLQVGFDKGLIDAGVIILTGERSSRSPLGNSLELVQSEIEYLHPTINLPVAVAVYDFGTPQAVQAVRSDGWEEHGPDNTPEEAAA